MNIKWDILNLKSCSSDGFITSALWLLTLEKNGITAQRRGRSRFSKNEKNEKNFIRFDNVKKEDVIEWVKGNLGNKLDDILYRMENEIATKSMKNRGLEKTVAVTLQ